MVTTRALVFALLCAAAAQAQVPKPAIVLNRDHVLVILPSQVLNQRSVRKQIDSALTTTFILKARIRGAKEEGSARIEIRYDLWDETFRVKRVQQHTLTAAQLDEWWRTPIDVLRFSGDRATVDLELIVLPFSAAEESDAREWLSKSGGTGDPSTTAPSVVDMLIGTTLNARPLVTFRWNVEIVRR